MTSFCFGGVSNSKVGLFKGFTSRLDWKAGSLGKGGEGSSELERRGNGSKHISTKTDLLRVCITCFDDWLNRFRNGFWSGLF